jgi:hypothetical protein
MTLFVVVIERRAVGARLLHGFAGRFLSAWACILVFFEVFDVRFFPNVFMALERGFLPANTLFEGGCGGWIEAGRFCCDVTLGGFGEYLLINKPNWRLATHKS